MNSSIKADESCGYRYCRGGVLNFHTVDHILYMLDKFQVRFIFKPARREIKDWSIE